MQEIVGRKINGILVNEDQSVLVFDTDAGDIIYKTAEDSVSETWFADLTGVSSLLGATVREAVSVDLEAIDDGRTRQEEDLFYGVKITTDKGYASLVYRNSSNGCYDGNVHLSQRPRPEFLTTIEDDWSA